MMGFLGVWLASTLFLANAMDPGLAVSGLPSLAPFLVVWASGGGLLLALTLRGVWGKDVLSLHGDEWTLFQGVGRLGFTRRFPRTAVQSVEIHRHALGNSPPVVTAQVKDKAVKLTAFGTPEQKLWLRDLALRECGLAVPTPRPASAPQVFTLPSAPLPGWGVDPLPDGSLRIVRREHNRSAHVTFLALYTLGCSVFAWITWTHSTGFGPEWPDFNPLLPRVLLTAGGAAGVAGLAWALWGREEWRVDVNRFLLIRRFLGGDRVRYFDGSTLALEVGNHQDRFRVYANFYGCGGLPLQTADGNGFSQVCESYFGNAGKQEDREELPLCSLVIRREGRRQVLLTARADPSSLNELRKLGALVSHCTGWPLALLPETAR